MLRAADALGCAFQEHKASSEDLSARAGLPGLRPAVPPDPRMHMQLQTGYFVNARGCRHCPSASECGWQTLTSSKAHEGALGCMRSDNVNSGG